MRKYFSQIALAVLVAALLFVHSARAIQPSSSRQQITADLNWRFILGDPSNGDDPLLDDSGWRTVNLPHDWSIEGEVDPKSSTGGGGGYFPAGIGWYRKSFTAPSSWDGKKVSVIFDGIASNATVYLNGHKIGFHPYAYTTFSINLTSELKLGKTNLIAVRVDNSEQPASRWYSGSGIYRHTQIVVTNPLHVAHWGVFVTTSEVSQASAKVIVHTRITNDTKAECNVIVETTLIDKENKKVGEGRSWLTIDPSKEDEVSQEIAIANPAIWSPDTPSLYRAVTRVREDRKSVDKVETTFGIRTLAWSPGAGLVLNGKTIKIDGGSVHGDNGPLGAAAFDRAEQRRVQLLKAAGFNAVRTAHNPPSPAFLEACDRAGLLVLDEPFDVWTLHKVKYDYASYFRDWWKKDLDSMVMRDRNHPSIIMWGIGNEITDMFLPAGANTAKELAERLRLMDNTRPLTEAFPGATYTPTVDAAMANLDIVGYNYNIRQNGVRDHDRIPNRLMITTESFPGDAYAEWRFSHDHTYTVGEFVWTAMDYLGESGIGAWLHMDPQKAQEASKTLKDIQDLMAQLGAPGAKNPFAGTDPSNMAASPIMRLWTPGYPWHAAMSGDIDLIGDRKPQSYYRDILWNGGDRVYVAVQIPAPVGETIVAPGWSVYPTLPSWSWAGQEGKDLRVEVYAGTQKVRLYLNDTPIGEQSTSTTDQRKTVFTVPYSPGVLKVVGLDDNREVATAKLQTAGQSAKVRLTADRSELDADGEDLSFLTVEALDSRGNPQLQDDREVEFSISGPGTIAAVGNGDGASSESYSGNRFSFFHGRALVVVRTTTSAGTIQLTAKAQGLGATQLVLHARPVRLATTLDR